MYNSLLLPHIMYDVQIYFGEQNDILEDIIILQKKIFRSKNSLP